MMDTEAASHHEGSGSPGIPHLFATIKTEPSDLWNPQSSQTTTNGISENYYTYTSLESLHPETSYSQYLTVMNNATTYNTVHPVCSYSNGAEDSDGPVPHMNYYKNDIMLYPRDEGLGSSPSSLNSASPPSLNDHPVINGSNGHHLFDTQNERSSPGDSAYSEDLPASRAYASNYPQCVKCGGVFGMNEMMWYRDNTGHFLCSSCCQVRSPQVVQSQEEEYELIDRKRKRNSNVSKNGGQSCTNCESTSTSLWRRNVKGEVVCNACGLYEKLHKNARPISMKKDTIQTRKRKPRGSVPKKKSSNANVTASTSKEYPVIATNSYTLPTYSTLHGRDSVPDLPPVHESVILPPISSAAPFYANYKSEMGTPYHLMTSSVISMPLERPRVPSSSPTNT